MHFCSQCANMYYISIDQTDPNKLVYYCRNCGNKDDMLAASGVTVTTSQQTNDNDFSHIINKYTKFDPTLPRVRNVLCPNAECPTNHSNDEIKEIIYIRYDNINMSYVYLCSTCDTVWKPR